MKKYTTTAFTTILLLVLGGTALATEQENSQVAYFAGGCFWCMEPPFEKEKGVIKAISGYMGGSSNNPTYKTYAQHGHIETVAIHYNPKIISYAQLLAIFWDNIDPTDPNGQFADRGKAYRSAIFYQNEKEKKEAEASKKNLIVSKLFDKPIVTELLKAAVFYPAEEYHQDYYKKHPIRYKWYRYRSGRDAFLKKVRKLKNKTN